MSQGRRLPTFPQLLARFGAQPDSDDVSVVSLSACLSSGDDPRNILAYLAGLGCAVASLDGLALAVNTLDDEEELGAFKVRDGAAFGVVVSIASHGAFVLFRP